MIEQFSNNELNRIEKNEHRELALWDAVLNPDILAEYDLDSEKHPSPEMMFIREALEKALMNHQKEVWAMYAYDHKTYVEIGKKLRISKQAARSQVKTIQKQIVKWCQKHKGIYETIKEAENRRNNNE